MNSKKLRFYISTCPVTNEPYYIIKAKRLSTGKFETIGSCHIASKSEILNGKTELIKYNFQLQTI